MLHIEFYKFDSGKNNSVDKISQEVLNLLEGQNLTENQKGEVVLKVLKSSFSVSSKALITSTINSGFRSFK